MTSFDLVHEGRYQRASSSLLGVTGRSARLGRLGHGDADARGAEDAAVERVARLDELDDLALDVGMKQGGGNVEGNRGGCRLEMGQGDNFHVWQAR